MKLFVCQLVFQPCLSILIVCLAFHPFPKSEEVSGKWEREEAKTGKKSVLKFHSDLLSCVLSFLYLARLNAEMLQYSMQESELALFYTVYR